jgi:streptomycin 6-kinase
MMGKSVGVTIRRIAVVSMKQPRNKSSTLMMASTEPGRFLRRLKVVVEAASLERQRLLHWILAWTGLSAAWFLSDGDSAENTLRIAELAAVELGP